MGGQHVSGPRGVHHGRWHVSGGGTIQGVAHFMGGWHIPWGFDFGPYLVDGPQGVVPIEVGVG